MKESQKEKVIGIGRSGAITSFVLKKSLLKKIIGGNYADCQQSINTEIETGKPWIQLNKVLQNLQGKGIATMIGKINSDNVVVKVQTAKDAEAEYNVQSKLRNINGFVKYNCTFQCDGDKQYVEQFTNVLETTRLCKQKGNSLGIIIMPYYRNGSLEGVLSSLTLDKLKPIIKQVIINYTHAYNTLSYTHGDFFCKNIVLDDSFAPIIIDFEKSSFNHIRKCDIFWTDLDSLFQDLSRHPLLSYKMYEIARVLVFHRAYQHEPTTPILDDLLKSLDYL